jgi:hypothetical protein
VQEVHVFWSNIFSIIKMDAMYILNIHFDIETIRAALTFDGNDFS